MPAQDIYPIPLSNNDPKAATRQRFRFLNVHTEEMGTKYVSYRPATIYRGDKWHVAYSYFNPNTKEFERFKVYENINRIKDLKEREEFAKKLKDAVNYHLDKGFNPFEEEEMKIEVRNWTLVQGLNYWKQNLGSRGLRDRSKALYGSVLKFLYEYLAPVLNEDINKITKLHIQTAFRKAQTERTWTNTTYNGYITFTRTIFNFLKDEGIVKENPAKIKPLPETIKRHKYFSDETFDKIKKESDSELLRFIMFLYHTGTRPKEAVQLKYENIIKESRGAFLFVPASISKNRRDGRVPVGDYILGNYKGEGLIFDVPDRHYSRRFSILRKKLKLDKETTLYAVKHTAAITMARNGVPMFSMMQFFRHTNLSTTESYLRGLGLELSWDASKGL